jgi:L-lactate dehydrogenase complex protein LldF
MAENHELPVVKSALMKAAGVLLANPTLYRAALSAADAALRHLPHFAIYNPLNTWTKGREMPPALAQTFHSWWAANRGRHGRAAR